MPSLSLYVEALAFHLAQRWLLQECPRSSPAAAERWAAQHWPQFREMAIDALAVLTLVREQRGLEALPGLQSLSR